MAKTRRTYSIAFKQKGVRLVRDQGLTILQAASEIGVHKSQMLRGVKRADDGELGQLPSKKQDASSPSLEAEVRGLKPENALLLEEREILKEPRSSSPRKPGEHLPVYRRGEDQRLDSTAL
ncbi:MAG: transposase-like protein [Myxococcota bacterium]|jgi:transposase-like protein